MRFLSAFLAPLALVGLAAFAAPAAGDFAYSSEDDFHYAYIEPGADGLQVMSGDYDRYSGIEDLARNADRPVLWFERDGREYVVRDARLIERARVATKPMMEIGREQGRLGAKQGKIGAKQGEIGGRMGELGGRLGIVATRLALARLTDEDSDDLADERASLQQAMKELNREQLPLAREQRELGLQQSELGRKQRDASKHAGSEMRKIFEEALRSGAAQRMSHTRSTVRAPETWTM